MIPYPTKCNICRGTVIFTSNARIYGKEYGTGKMYYCVDCGAYVGTNPSNPKMATGLLANAKMRELKKKCKELSKDLFGKKKDDAKEEAKRWLAGQIKVSPDNFSFSYLSEDKLEEAIAVLEKEKARREQIKKAFEERKSPYERN